MTHLLPINLAPPRGRIPPRHYAILRRKPNSGTTPNILNIHTIQRIRPISHSSMMGLITLPVLIVRVVVVVAKVLNLRLLLLLPALLALPVRRAPNHRRHRHLLRRRGRATHAPKLCRGKVVLFLAATIGSGCGFVCGGGGGEGGEQEGRDGGFAASGLDNGRDLRVWTRRICLRNGLVELASGSPPFLMLSHR
jgi:hypothetical protein